MKIGDITGKMQETRLQLLGHVVRRQAGEKNAGGKKEERPRRRWEDCVKEDMKERNQ